MKYQWIVVLCLLFIVCGCTSSSSPPNLYNGLRSGKLYLRSDSRFTGKTLVSMLNILGNPDIIQNDAPAKVLIYRSPICVFAVFLYKAEGDSDYLVRRSEFRSTNRFFSNDLCLQKIHHH